jgi:micrococcal nuclease
MRWKTTDGRPMRTQGMTLHGHELSLLGTVLVVAGLLLGSNVAAEEKNIPIISDEEAIKHVGEHVIVRGAVAEVSMFHGGTMFLNFGKRHPNQTFTAVIFRSDFPKFDNPKQWEGRQAMVEGTVKLYKGRPQIILNDPKQISPVLPVLCPAHAEDFSGEVVVVVDGDTIDVMHGEEAERIRLNGIDCPEKDQCFGECAKQFTSDLALGKEVTVRAMGHDRHGQPIGDVILPDGLNLNQELVQAGMAWWFRRYSNDSTLEQLEEEAKAAKRGLWADCNPIPPWDFRPKR